MGTAETERVEARLSPGQRQRIDQATALEGQARSSSIVAAATERAEHVIRARMTTVIASAAAHRVMDQVEALHDEHELDSFECGNTTLSGWLECHALQARGRGTGMFVLVDEGAGSVVGYFAIAPHLVAREEVPARIARGAPNQIPAILRAKLGVGRAVDVDQRVAERVGDDQSAAGRPQPHWRS
ncbi:MAG: DUF1778 domain-containing protein [Actinobacteria bacterium]|nr:DUF1778 domain-containing protein [Actinomycetota bacterium]